MTYRVREEIGKNVRKELEEHSELVAKLLGARGVASRAEAEAFLNPNYEEGLYDPLLLNDIEVAAERILKAVADNGKITIYSDYDADGIPGAVVLSDFFKKIGYDNFINYIPHRNREGFGLNVAAIEKLANEEVKLIVTIDCGIGDTDEVARANELGVDVIITDHHLPNGELPQAFAIVNPNHPDCSYPNKHLCGAGVAFKLVQVLMQKTNHTIVPGWDKWLLDMVGLSTIADMVPLTGENRVLAHFGLYVLRKSRRPGLQKLLKKIRVDQRRITEDDIGFMVAPRINAASRIGVPEDAFRVLATNDDIEADTLVKHLDKINTERKTRVALMTKEIKKRISQMGEPHEVIVMGNPEWLPSLAGLAANSLMDEYKRPAFVWGRGEAGVIKGSCRSDGSINLVELMSAAKDSFIEFGGHECSGGFSVELDNIHHLEENLLQALSTINRSEMKKELEVDGLLTLEEVNWELYKQLERLAPYGEGNPKPQFIFQQAPVASVRQFGTGDAHLEVQLSREFGTTVGAIAFFAGPDSFQKKVVPGEKADVIASLEASHFRGRPELRLRLIDVL